MKKILLFLGGFLILIVGFIAFQYYQLTKYSPLKVDISTLSPISVTTTRTGNHFLEKMSYYLDDTEYISYDYGESFVPIDESVLNTQINLKSQITFNIEHNILKNISKLDSKLETVEYISLMNHSKISNEINLIKYYIENQNQDLNLLDSIYKIKINYYSSIFVDRLDLSGNIAFLNGIDGYMLKKNGTTLLGLFYEGNLYQITFGSDYDDTFVKEFLNSVEFNS